MQVRWVPECIELIPRICRTCHANISSIESSTISLRHKHSMWAGPLTPMLANLYNSEAIGKVTLSAWET